MEAIVEEKDVNIEQVQNEKEAGSNGNKPFNRETTPRFVATPEGIIGHDHDKFDEK